MYKNQMKRIRMSKSMTLGKLSEITGISSGYLCHLEKGSRKNPSMHVMELIADGLGVSVAEVFFE